MRQFVKYFLLFESQLVFGLVYWCFGFCRRFFVFGLILFQLVNSVKDSFKIKSDDDINRVGFLELYLVFKYF